ncbi:TPA: Lar family restriction alleviation protein [Pseudomonas aeruginosa]|nr:Lar family restriction alleviation protein [Pseudomonas aeruginosa]HCF2811477.1 Lar family restriction alleviation protein [Pseudomonas aeruginosa]HCF3394007.1 Lar family restriction alleviation protein [Pseudomonas aeruginosa]
MAEELKPCPFCGCSMRLESNRDWHKIVGDHALECAFTDSETMVVPATKEQRDIAVSDWNARAVPAGHVVVSEGLLRRLLDSDGIDGIFDAQQNYAAHQELRALLSEQAGEEP